MKINQIKLGTRHRRDYGDLEALASSIADVGLLHPVVVDLSGQLIAGERRLRAVRLLDWSDVPVTVAKNLDDAAKALKAERDENKCRLNFSPSEMVALAKQLEPMERVEARQRQGERSDKLPEKISGSVPSSPARMNGNASDKVAEAVGVSRPTLTKATAVVEAAKAHPAQYREVQEEMDRTGKVAPAYEKLAEKASKPDAPAVKLPIAPRHSPRPKDISWSWSKAMQTIWEQLGVVKQKGGIKELLKEWSEKDARDYLTQLKQIQARFATYIPALEEHLK